MADDEDDIPPRNEPALPSGEPAPFDEYADEGYQIPQEGQEDEGATNLSRSPAVASSKNRDLIFVEE